MTIQDPIKNTIWNFINHYAYGDALFLAERLYAEVATDDALLLLATVYYRIGKPRIVKVLFEKHGLRFAGCKLLYAQACYDLEEINQAEHALVGNALRFHSISALISEIQSHFGDSACFALSLLGSIYQQTERQEWSEKCLLASVKSNPFMWTSFERMCNFGKMPNPDELFTSASIYNHHPEAKVTLSSASLPCVPVVQRKKKNIAKVLMPSQSGPNTDSFDSSHHTLTNSMEYICQSNSNANATIPNSIPSFTINRLEEVLNKSDRLKEAQTDTDRQPEFLRSTPTTVESNQWDSSIDSNLSVLGSGRRPTRTQQQISRSLMTRTAHISPMTPSFGIAPLVDTPSPIWERNLLGVATPSDTVPPNMDAVAPVKKMVTRQSRKTTETMSKLLFSSENNRNASSAGTAQSTPTGGDAQQGSARRTTRSTGSSLKENTKKTNKGKSGQPRDILRRSNKVRQNKQTSTDPILELSEEISKVDPTLSDKIKLLSHPTPSQLSSTQTIITAQKAAVDALMSLLREMGRAVVAMGQFDCRKAVAAIESLPLHQRDTPWSLSLLAKAYFELTEYKKAAQVFEEIRSRHSHHVTGLALFSSTLWHLQDHIQLSVLAHDLTKLDPLSSETWCAVGNCFSLRRDYDNAIKFFARAVQQSPRYAYAHTLLGHEYLHSDDTERAMSCYRRAVHCDQQHYNAWYGIGTIYYKQENFSLAEIHYKRALSINHYNLVLLCHLGIVQHSQKRSTEALNTLARALEIDKRNALCKFHRASILLYLDRLDEALGELLELKQIIPKESLVYFLMGKVFKAKGENHLAMMNFSWALDLDPKGINNHIKEAIDKQQQNLDDDAAARDSDNDDDLVVDTPVMSGESSGGETSSSIDLISSLRVDYEDDVIPDSEESL